MNIVSAAILDPARGTTCGLTLPDTSFTSPVWSPDNKRVLHSLLRDGAYDLYIKETKPGDVEQRLLHTNGMKAAQSWSRDGKVILFNALGAKTRLDLWSIDATPNATARILVGGEADECCGGFSGRESGSPTCRMPPDGRRCSSNPSAMRVNRYKCRRTAAARLTGMRADANCFPELGEPPDAGSDRHSVRTREPGNRSRSSR